MTEKKETDLTFDNLNEIYQKDFKTEEVESYDELKFKIISSIKNFEKIRSLESQKIEAMAKIEENSFKNIFERANLIVSFTIMGISIITAWKLSENFFIIFIIALLYFLVNAVIFVAQRRQEDAYKKISYYRIKLYCIEEIEKERQEEANKKAAEKKPGKGTIILSKGKTYNVKVKLAE